MTSTSSSRRQRTDLGIKTVGSPRLPPEVQGASGPGRGGASVAARQVGGEGGVMLGQSSEERSGRAAALVAGGAVGNGAAL
jgi:hypothetical protein